MREILFINWLVERVARGRNIFVLLELMLVKVVTTRPAEYKKAKEKQDK